jgi:hypothetical protein
MGTARTRTMRMAMKTNNSQVRITLPLTEVSMHKKVNRDLDAIRCDLTRYKCKNDSEYETNILKHLKVQSVGWCRLVSMATTLIHPLALVGPAKSGLKMELKIS